MKLFFMQIVALMSSSPITVPFQFDARGLAQVNVCLMRFFPSTPFSFSLTAVGGNSVLWNTLHDDDDRVDELIASELAFYDASSPFQLLDTNLLMSFPLSSQLTREYVSGASRKLGIGLGSWLLSRFDSVDFLRNRQQIVLYDYAGHSFQENCIPNSILGIPLFRGRVRADWTMTIGLGYNDPHSLIASIEISNDEKIIQVGPYALHSLMLMISNQIGPHGRIDNCMYVRSQLPPISLGGQIMIRPEDYTTLYSDGTCGLMIGTHGGDMGQVKLNPLRIPGVNARFTQEQVLLCQNIGH